MKKLFSIVVLCCVLLTACAAEIQPNDKKSVEMLPEFKINDYLFSQSTYQPGQPVQLDISITSLSESPADVTLMVRYTYLNEVVEEQTEVLQKGHQTWSCSFVWQPPEVAPRGYGLDISILSENGSVLAAASDGFDVLQSWKEMPRYGFLVDYAAGRSDAAETMTILNRYHINGLQFYDWMYRHEQFFSTQEPYLDILDRQLSLETVKHLISAAHERNMAAMPYTAVYGASKAFYEQHPDWALLDAKGEPVWFGENFMVIMDPRPDSEWTKHLMAEFAGILEKTDFDGIHLDQYGHPKVGYDASGNSYPLDKALAAMINETKDLVNQKQPDGTVVFNAVTNWPIEVVAPSNQDFVYIEVWAPYTSFNELGQIIIQAQKLGSGKPVVLAAYIDPQNKTNALIMDALIFANGAGRIELGEKGGYLADPYFPLYKMPDPELADWLQRYYGFAVRYQDVIGPRTTSANAFTYQNVRINSVETNTSLTHDKVMVIGRDYEKGLAISLVNMIGLKHGEWAGEVQIMPTPLSDLVVQIKAGEKTAKAVWSTSADNETYDLQPLDFTQDGGVLRVIVPDLIIWDVLLVDWSE
ncbi:MAG: hypothetical protein CL609_25725 [Anaerolineaceae bacterium]|nr:hypothetical protein [Anaerolineaceae bacterium]